MQGIRVQFESEKYNDVLRETSRMLNVRNLGREFDRNELMLLRAQANLRLRKFKNAQDGFEELAALPAVDQKAIQERCLWQTTSVLIDKSTPRGYVVRSGGKREIIDLVDPESLKKALKAFYKDESADIVQRVDQAVNRRQLVSILAVLPDVSRLTVIEIGVTGSDANSKIIRDRTFKNASALIDTYLSNSAREVRAIEDRANQLIEMKRERRDNGQVIEERYFVRRGLGGRETSDLKDMQNTCKGIAKVINQIQSNPLKDPKRDFAVDPFEPLKGPTQDLYDSASRVLATDYSGDMRSADGVPPLAPRGR